jgi:hypothetical protein
MIKQLEDMPAGVVGFEASGMLRAEEYKDVIVPALERAAESGDLRFVLVIPEFKGMTGSAVWEDLKTGVSHLRHWKKIALVTDVDWMSHLTSLFGWMTPGQTRVFSMAERDEALAWVAA